MQTPGNVVGWFEIYVADMERARTFYKGVFQREMMDLPSMGSDLQMCAFAWKDNGPGASGALVRNAQMAPGVGGTMVYFSCEDCAVEAARVTSHGGTVCQQKMSIGEYGFIAIAQDTEGNTIGLHSRA